MDVDQLERHVNGVRFISIMAAIAAGLGSLLVFVIGGVKVFRAYSSYLAGSLFAEAGHQEGAKVAIAWVVQAIGAFLIAIVLLIPGSGIYNLFLHQVPGDLPGAKNVIAIRNIAQLKSILAELVIIVLMVKFLELALRSLGGHQLTAW